MVRIDDIIAALLLSLAMMRRLEVLSTTLEQQANVRQVDFEHWRRLALSGYHLTAVACVAKVVLSLGWFYFVHEAPTLQIGGVLIFCAWAVVLVVAWRRTTEARAFATDVGIKPGRRRE